MSVGFVGCSFGLNPRADPGREAGKLARLTNSSFLREQETPSFSYGEECELFVPALDIYKFLMYNISMKILYKANTNIVYSCKYHIVWCTKYRKDIFSNSEAKLRLENILISVCKELKADLIEYEIMPDHVHLLLEVDPQLGIHKVVKRLKGRSSRFLRKEFPSIKSRLPTLWTNSYFCSTVGGATLKTIKEYIENQTNK